MAKRLAHRPIGAMMKARPTWRTVRLADGGKFRYRMQKLKGKGHIYFEVEGLAIEGFGAKDLTDGGPKA